MPLETVLDDGQYPLVDEPADGVLHHSFVLGDEAADVVEIEGIQHLGTFLISLQQSSAPARVSSRRADCYNEMRNVPISVRDAQPAIQVPEQPQRPDQQELQILE